MMGLIAGTPYTKRFYSESLKMLYELFSGARKAGMARLEEEIEHPNKGGTISKYPKFLKNRHALHFLCDTLRVAVSGNVDPFDIDTMMEVDLEVHHHDSNEPVAALATMADSLPGLGIVAAVLGVVITMGSLGGGKEEIGQKVAAALVGTFLGILLCYGVFGPIAGAMSKQNEGAERYLGFLRMASLAFVRGLAPIMAVEVARRSIPYGLRPTFQEMEAECRGGGAAAKAA
jgi:chemotaxis protein MotA